MPTRSIIAEGRLWQVYPSGRVTQYDRDEFGIIFVSEASAVGTVATGSRDVRVTRYSPQGARSREQSLLELSESDLLRLFRASQPGETSPETDYSA